MNPEAEIQRQKVNAEMQRLLEQTPGDNTLAILRALVELRFAVETNTDWLSTVDSTLESVKDTIRNN